MRRFEIPLGVWGLVKEAARHLLRRPVVGLIAFARTPDGKVVLIRRGDTGNWAMPGGTLEWGETLRTSLERELLEEAGVKLIEAGKLLGVYSDPGRDVRFHAVTVVVEATVEPPHRPPMNAVEILEVRLFDDAQLDGLVDARSADVLERARKQLVHWE